MIGDQYDLVVAALAHAATEAQLDHGNRRYNVLRRHAPPSAARYTTHVRIQRRRSAYRRAWSHTDC